MGTASTKIDYGLMKLWSNSVLCSRCLKRGIKTPVEQIISVHHRLLSNCRNCRDHSSKGVIRYLNFRGKRPARHYY